MLDHEKLDVYQRSIQFFALSAQITEVLPRGNNYLADQLKRASLSIPLNIAEGAGKLTRKDQQRFYAIARGSAMECGAVWDAMKVLELCGEQEVSTAKRQLITIVNMLSRMCGVGRKRSS